MKRITKIEEVKNYSFQKKLRVAAYCRVSTSSEEQIVSLETQKAHYKNYIQSNDEWECAGIYYDKGITGTKVENRIGLMALMEDCKLGKIDFIITKSISRFSRNTTDCLEMVRKLQKLNIPILFEKKDFYTQEMPTNSAFTALSKGTWCLVGV